MASGAAARERSRSPHQTARTGKAGTKRWSTDFDKWAKENLSEKTVKSSESMMSAYKRADRFKNAFIELLEKKIDIDVTETQPCGFDNALRPFAMEAARKDFAKKQKKMEETKKEEQKRLLKKEKKKEKKDKKMEEKKELKSQGKKIQDLMAQIETMKKQRDRKKDSSDESSADNEDDGLVMEPAKEGKIDVGEPVKEDESDLGEWAIALPIVNSPLQMALQSVQDEKSKAEKKLADALNGLKEAEQKKINLMKQTVQLQKSIATLTVTAKKLPVVKSQLDQMQNKLRSAQFDKSRAEVTIERAKDVVKSAQAELRNIEKGEAALQTQVDLEQARVESNDGLGEDTSDAKLLSIFNAIDRDGSGVITKIGFIKALENPEVSKFVNLPSTIRQEDGSRDALEEVFQNIAKENGKSFTRIEFENFYSEAQASFSSCDFF